MNLLRGAVLRLTVLRLSAMCTPATSLRPGSPRSLRGGAAACRARAAAWAGGRRGSLAGLTLLTPLAGLAPLALLAVLALSAGGCSQRATGELLGIQDDQHRIADPGKLGASATGSACGATEREALTSARRVAQFNLRSLTGEARYLVRYELLGTSRTGQRVCVEVSALAVEPRPYNR